MATFSLNGPDNIGKTTQITLLPKEINRMGSLVIKEMPTENSSKWWFKECPTPTFTKSIIEALKERQKKISSGINLFDRGTLMFKAVCIATAVVKDGIEIREAYEIINDYFNDVQKEAVQIFLKYGQDAESIKEMRSRENHEWDEQYENYQTKLRKAIAFLLNLEPENVVEIECEHKSIIDIQNEIRSIIGKDFRPILNTVKSIFGIGGLSESGKSFCGRHLKVKHGFIPLKKVYFDEINTAINGKSIYDENDEDNAILTILALDKFCNAHYYFPYISIESLRSFGVTKYMKKLLGDKFVIIFLDVDEKVRYKRATEKEKKMFDKKENTKKCAGAHEIKAIADNVINNCGKIEDLKLSIDKIVNLKINA